MGIRTRTRQCMRGEAGRGGCLGNSMVAEECRTDTCLAQCPPGFFPMGMLLGQRFCPIILSEILYKTSKINQK